MATTTTTRVKLKRSSFACRHCHRLKMKCDITAHGIPCSRCVARGREKNCELFPSKKRANHELPSRKHTEIKEENSVLSPTKPDKNSQPAQSQSLFAKKDSIASPDLGGYSNSLIFPPSIEEPAVDEEEMQLTPKSTGGWNGQILSPLNWMPSFSNSRAQSPVNFSMPAPTSTNIATTTSAASGSASNGNVFVSLSKGKDTVELYIDRVRQGHVITKQTMSFLGESCPLSMLLRRPQDSGHVYMAAVTNQTSMALGAAETTVTASDSSPSAMSTSSTHSSSPSVASKIDSVALDELMSTYFRVIHPFYPIINRRSFAQLYACNQVPPLLLNAMCFAACYHCDSSVIHCCGFAYRADAKDAFYREAKTLFDQDCEPDLLTVVQASFLLSFCGGKPRQVWNSRTWLSVAVTAAEDLGMHRSTAHSNVDELDQAHMRIIWWCMVVRDIMTSITLGRPHKICELRCDVDLLSLADFEMVDRDPENELFGRADRDYYHLLIEFCKANVIMWKVFSDRYDPRSGPSSYNPERYSLELVQWRSQLPECLDWELPSTASSNSVPATYAAMVYHHLMIYIYRPRMIDSEKQEMCSLEESVTSANAIVAQVAKLAVTNILSIPQDIYSLFVTAMAILIVDYKTNRSVVSKLQIQICLMTLSQGKDSWDHAVWLRHTFERLLEDDTTEDEDASSGTYVFGADRNKDVDLLLSLITPIPHEQVV